VIIFVLMLHFGLSAISTAIVMATLALAGSAICVIFSPAVIAATGKIDPSEVVADELAGQALVFFAVLLLVQPLGGAGLAAHTYSPSPSEGLGSAKQLWIIAGLGFVLFRLFDIVKPWPINILQKLPQGWGILADDLLAGVYAAIVLLLCIRLWIIGTPAGP